MQTSKAGIDLIKASEGFKPHLYDCPARDCSIGFGHLVHHGPTCGAASEASYLSGIDEVHATSLLITDVSYAEHAVEHLVKVALTQGQFDALVSFTYNEGAGKLQSSTLLRYLNAGNYAGAANQFLVWVYGGGVKLPGLITRRAAEVALFRA
jgi:lysozyme